MSESIVCPDVSLLRHFLDGTEFHDETWSRGQIELHVNDCQVCQKSIERLVAGQESWEGAARQLAEIDANRGEASSELRDLIDQEKNRLPGTKVCEMGVTEERPLSSIELDFLQPIDQPDSLGRLGSYEILDVVGRGGMGLVLKAYDPSLRRIVAIKVMAAHLASSPAARKRFVREARAAAAVSHDHVVAIYAVEENQEPPFLVMQFVSGKTLQERLIATGSLSVPEILRIGMQTASGLAAAHAQGLVHRDIKPANILLENGVERVKITDFGLARAVDDVGMTQTGVVAGTPQFMAPEQANGESIDIRSDLFSLGSVLYTLCTGRPPFRATTTMGLLKRICEETPRPIRELNPEIPEWLEAIIGKLLKKNASDRYQTAKEVAELLSNWLAHVQRPTAVPAPSVVTDEKERPKQDSAKNLNSDIEPKRVDSISRIVPKSRPLPLWGNYSQLFSCNSDVESFFDFAVQTLQRNGFVVTERTPSRLKLDGPWWNKVMNRALSPVRRIDFQIEPGTLNVQAKLRTLGLEAVMLIPVLALLSFFAGALIAIGPVLVIGLWYLGRCRQLEERFTKFVAKLVIAADTYSQSSALKPANETMSNVGQIEDDSSDGFWKF
ncbi:MAG: serine/threonine-protein kinase, partial [Schlesneria sp.]